MSSTIDTLKQTSKSWLKRGLRRAFQTGGSRSIAPEHWGLERDADGALSWGGVNLTQLATSYGSPLHVVNSERLRENARRFLSKPNGSARGCEVFYSYKTNPVPAVLCELHAAGIGAEVISHYELWLALALGTPPDRIIYNGPAKSEASIRLALEVGIQLLNINHREEIPVVARAAQELGRRPAIGVRVTLGGWAGQFGTLAVGGQALRVFEEALAAGCLDVVGLHIHRGGMIRSEDELHQHVDGVLHFADELRERLGLKLEILDLGGSLASPSVRALTPRELRLNRSFSRALEAPLPEATLSIERYVATLVERITDHHARRGEPAPRVFVEPGRALTSDAQLLLTQVLSIKRDDERTFAILDAGINLAESCRSEYHEIFATKQANQFGSAVYTLVGPICVPSDTLRWAARLPELRPGDTLAIMDSGAYFVPFSTSFSFPQPGIVMVQEGRVTPIRRAETFSDRVSYDQHPDLRQRCVDPS